MSGKRKESSNATAGASKRPRTGSKLQPDSNHEEEEEGDEEPADPGGSFFAQPASSPPSGDALASPSDGSLYSGEGPYPQSQRLSL